MVVKLWREPASTSLSPFRRSTTPSFASWVFQVCILASCLIFGCPGLNQSYRDSLHDYMIKHQIIGYSLPNTSLLVRSALPERNQECHPLCRLWHTTALGATIYRLLTNIRKVFCSRSGIGGQTCLQPRRLPVSTLGIL